jgi:hypothetical protein
MELIAGVGLFTVNAVAADVPPPGAGFCTVIWFVELPDRSAAGTTPTSCVALTTLVAISTPFQPTNDPATNPVPVTVTIVSFAPAVTLEGLTLVIVGVGSFTEKLTGEDVPPPGAGFTTVSCPTVALARSLAGIVVFKLVAEANVVVSAAPFHSTVELAMNPEPDSVTGVSAEPTAAEDGLTEVTSGAGF